MKTMNKRRIKVENNEPINQEEIQDTEVTENPETENEEVTEEVKEAEKTAEEKLAQELSDQKDMYLRLMAEYDNFRKRTAKEKSETFSDAVVKTMSEILPVIDNFERAISADTADESFKSGVVMIFNQLKESLKKIGIEEINPIGQQFDPNIANAVNQIEDENLGENEVAQVFQKGYRLGDKIIRYAMVVVANP